jgi:tetratricopeptide (TPR) repeat protein
MERAVDADPLNVLAIAMRCLILGACERADEGLEVATRALELDPDSFLLRYVTLQSQVWAGRPEDAIASAHTALRMSGRHPWALGVLGVAYASADDREKAEAVYDELRARRRLEYMQPFWLAYLASALGRPDEAMAWARRGAVERDPMCVFLKRWPEFGTALREHPDYPTLLTELAG